MNVFDEDFDPYKTELEHTKRELRRLIDPPKPTTTKYVFKLKEYQRKVLHEMDEASFFSAGRGGGKSRLMNMTSLKTKLKP